jgi:hypothetical protein
MVEGLSKRLEKERIEKTIPGIKIANGAKRMKNSQFVDDTLLMGGTSTILATRFNAVMEDYTTTSRGLINKEKIQLYTWNVKDREMEAITNCLNFPYTKKWSFFKYLGVPTGPPPSIVWRPIIEKIQAKISHWGTLWLNPTGRVTLLKSIISSLPIFQCSIFLAPAYVKLSIAQAIRKFLWQGGKLTQKDSI